MAQATQHNDSFDIVIVGGGIVGLTLALSLAGGRAAGKLSLALIDGAPHRAGSGGGDAESGIGAFDPRVSAVTAASRGIFEALGAWPAVAGRACPYREMFVWDAEGTGNIRFDAADIHREDLGHIVENGRLCAALYRALDETGVDSIQGDALEALAPGGAGYRLTLAGGRSLECRLLIGADGANSMVREQCGFRSRSRDYGQEAVVATVRTADPHRFSASQCFLAGGPLAFLPLLSPDSDRPQDQYWSSIVWSCRPETAAELLALDDAGFCRALSGAFEYRLGEVEETGPRFGFPLRESHVREYVQDHVALVGDAAHTIHPLAGQGVNLGIQDAAVLGEVVDAAAALGEDWSGRRILSRYQRRRKGPNLGMMLLMEGFRRGFGSEDLAVRWLRNAGLSWTDRTLPVKRRLIEKAMGL